MNILFFIIIHKQIIMFSTTCNSNCICIDADCKFTHLISYKERKIVKKLYSTLSNITKEEPSFSTRKKNCTFGQLCINDKCGFRHRLCFENREKLSVLYNYNKICPDKNEEKKSETISKKLDIKEIKTNNLFLNLDDDVDDIQQEEIKEIKENKKIKENKEIINDVKPFTPPVYSGKSWVSVIIEGPKPKELNLNIESSNWEELADEDFYMKF